MDIIGEAIQISLPEPPLLPLNGLHRLSAAVNRADRLEDIYEAAIEALLASLGADRAAILLYDDAKVMRFVASQGLSQQYRAAVEGHSPWTPESLDPQPILINDVHLDEDLAPYLETITEEGIRALGFVPLLYRSTLLGKFMVYFDQAHSFSEQERMLAQTIADQVAFAIEQKRTEDNLRLYRMIFEHSPTGIGVIDLNSRYVRQNASHRAMIGYTPEELSNATPAIHLGEESFHAVKDALTKEDTFTSEMISTAKDGSRTDIELTAFVVRDQEGQPLCFVGMKHDISGRKAVERQTSQLNHELEERVALRTEELQRAKDEMEGFCYSVSHDLRAPLRGISGSAMMLIEDYGDKLDTDAQHHLKRLSAASVRMAKLIDDLLEYSRLGRKEPDRSTVDLRALSERVLEDLRQRKAGCSNLIATLHDVPCVQADPQLMEIVLHNLFGNACKFTMGRENPIVEFGATLMGGRHVFFVRDNGAGFDEQFSHKLFRPFERLHSEKEYPGTGIGLANVKRIIERHGGEVWGEAKLNEGATFYFTLG